MILRSLEYMHGVCAWLDGKDLYSHAYANEEQITDWTDGWNYANTYYTRSK